MSIDKFPDGWTQVTLQSIASWGSGGTPSRSQSEYYNGEIPWIKTGDLGPRIITQASEFITEAGVKNSSAKFFTKGSVVLAMYGATIGKTSILGIDATTNQACAVGTPTAGVTSSEFLYYLLLNEKKAFIKKGKGGAQPNISQAVIKEHTVCLPPTAEQKIIADKLDDLLARVESIKTRLEKIPEILKKFRQSVLSTAVSGKLTEERAPWQEVLLQDACTAIVDCPHSTPKWSPSGKYCVRTTAFKPFELDLSEQGFVDEETYKNRIQRLKPMEEDILYSREGTVGIACQIPKGVELCLGQRMILIRANDKVLSKYLTIVLNSNKILDIVNSKIMGSTAPRINLSDIRAFPIPLPSILEQEEVIFHVEHAFNYGSSIESRIKKSLSLINNLTQSILAKAFRGELTAQWREENPELISGLNSAEALLEKITAEKLAAGTIKKRAKKSSH